MNGYGFHVEGIYEKGVINPTAPQYPILPDVIPSPDPRWKKHMICNIILKIAELDCCQIIILSIYVPSTHAYTHVLRLSLDSPCEKR